MVVRFFYGQERQELDFFPSNQPKKKFRWNYYITQYKNDFTYTLETNKGSVGIETNGHFCVTT